MPNKKDLKNKSSKLQKEKKERKDRKDRKDKKEIKKIKKQKDKKLNINWEVLIWSTIAAVLVAFVSIYFIFTPSEFIPEMKHVRALFAFWKGDPVFPIPGTLYYSTEKSEVGAFDFWSMDPFEISSVDGEILAYSSKTEQTLYMKDNSTYLSIPEKEELEVFGLPEKDENWSFSASFKINDKQIGTVFSDSLNYMINNDATIDTVRAAVFCSNGLDKYIAYSDGKFSVHDAGHNTLFTAPDVPELSMFGLAFYGDSLVIAIAKHRTEARSQILIYDFDGNVIEQTDISSNIISFVDVNGTNGLVYVLESITKVFPFFRREFILGELYHGVTLIAEFNDKAQLLEEIIFVFEKDAEYYLMYQSEEGLRISYNGKNSRPIEIPDISKLHEWAE